MRVILHNPLLAGFYPDPSICRVEDDFYMVTSSFSYFPGVPIFHSRDLAHWEQIGHVLDRPEQLSVGPFEIYGGIFAPTIRWHEGVFYMITTNASAKGNFIVTAYKPEGPWSEPHWLEEAEGIDPSLFWDDDGTSYYVGTSEAKPENNGKPMIWISQIDLKSFRLIGEKIYLWSGSREEPAWPEAPHIYKINGYYYLMIAEGGTEHFHSESIARAERITGPYHSYLGNPILTQRHLGKNAEIVSTGHGDLIQLKDGSWYMVFLASRPYGGYHKNLGRETFIAPVVWEDGWPVVSPGTGSIQFEYEGPELPVFEAGAERIKDDFDEERLSYQWNFLGTPDKDTVRIENSHLKIKLYDKPIGKGIMKYAGESLRPVQPQSIGFLGRRQQHMSFVAGAKLCFVPRENQTAGMVILQNKHQQMRIELGRRENGETVVRALQAYHSLEASLVSKKSTAELCEIILNEKEWNEPEAILVMEAQGQEYTLSVVDSQGNKIKMAVLDGGYLGSETAGGYVGSYIGMFASGNGTAYDDYAEFDWFFYEGRNEGER